MNTFVIILAVINGCFGCLSAFHGDFSQAAFNVSLGAFLFAGICALELIGQ